MATVKITFGRAQATGVPTFVPSFTAAETLTSTGTTQPTTAQAAQGDYAHVTAVDGAVHVDVGTVPVASAARGYVLASGETKSFGPLPAGAKVAIINV